MARWDVKGDVLNLRTDMYSNCNLHVIYHLRIGYIKICTVKDPFERKRNRDGRKILCKYFIILPSE